MRLFLKALRLQLKDIGRGIWDFCEIFLIPFSLSFIVLMLLFYGLTCLVEKLGVPESIASGVVLALTCVSAIVIYLIYIFICGIHKKYKDLKEQQYKEVQ